MKGYRFFAEMPQDRGSKSASKANPFFPWTVGGLRKWAAEGLRCDVVALFLEDDGRPVHNGSGHLEGLSVAIGGNPLSYAVGGMSRDYLRHRCTRIPESLARQLSPQLFHRLES
jgi:hypothetical protein